MAEGLLRHDAGDRFEVFSAGTKPSSVRPEAIAAMRELGIDISGHRSKSVDEFSGRQFDYVLTVCDNAKEVCPIFPGRTIMIHQSFEDPAALQGCGFHTGHEASSRADSLAQRAKCQLDCGSPSVT
jgi:arsenate reductase